MKKEKGVYNVISLGAGKQSSYMLIRALQGHFSVFPDAAVFSDLGSEPKWVYNNLKFLQEYCQSEFNFTISIVNPGNLGENILKTVSGIKTREATPPFYLGNSGMLRRHCTSNYKIRPVRQFLKKNRAGRKVKLWIGISLDESERMKISDVQYIKHYYPLIEHKITISQIKHWYSKNPFPEPGKSSCYFCPFHTDSYWKILKRNFPNEFKKACSFDDKIRSYPGIKSKVYLHRSGKPLNSIDFSQQPSLFPELIEECEGLCGL